MIENDREFPPLSPQRSAALSPLSLLAMIVTCVLTILICIAFIDRPAATWSHEVLRQPVIFVWMSRLVEPLTVITPLSLLLAGCAGLTGWRPGARCRLFLMCCLSTVIASLARTELKILFGRTWPETFTNNNPSWISNGVFGFSPFHGGAGWSSFPSGHTALIVGFLAVLWSRLPTLRPLYAVLILVEIVGLYGADYHFISDIIAGALVGVIAAAAAVVVTERALTNKPFSG